MNSPQPKEILADVIRTVFFLPDQIEISAQVLLCWFIAKGINYELDDICHALNIMVGIGLLKKLEKRSILQSWSCEFVYERVCDRQGVINRCRTVLEALEANRQLALEKELS